MNEKYEVEIEKLKKEDLKAENELLKFELNRLRALGSLSDSNNNNDDDDANNSNSKFTIMKLIVLLRIFDSNDGNLFAILSIYLNSYFEIFKAFVLLQ